MKKSQSSVAVLSASVLYLLSVAVFLVWFSVSAATIIFSEPDAISRILGLGVFTLPAMGFIAASIALTAHFRARYSVAISISKLLVALSVLEIVSMIGFAWYLGQTVVF